MEGNSTDPIPNDKLEWHSVNCNIVLTVCLMNLHQNILVTSCSCSSFSCATEITSNWMKMWSVKIRFCATRNKDVFSFFTSKDLLKTRIEEMHVPLHCCLRWFWIMNDSKSPGEQNVGKITLNLLRKEHFCPKRIRNSLEN